MSDDEQRLKLSLIDEVFRPSAPVDRTDLFSGRIDQLASVVEAIGAVGQHAVIFGERGAGKTSLAATCAEIAKQRGMLAIRFNCDQADNFSSLWQKVIDEFQAVLPTIPSERREEVRAATEQATEVLNFSEVGPNQVRVASRYITAVMPLVIFMDEFDQLQDPGALALISNTVKLLSDQIEPVTLVPVGVSDSVAGLIQGHQSIQRNLAQVRMPRMTQDELVGILDRGLRQLGMTAQRPARGFVQTVPRGLPQYAHLLAQEGGRQALLEGETEITYDHVYSGLQVGLSKLDHSLRSAFDEATYTPGKSRFEDVLYACVAVDPDADGFFPPASLRRPYSRIIGREVNVDSYNPQLTALSQGRGEILFRKGGARQRRYRFSDPLMEPYVLMRGLTSERLTTDILYDYR